MKCTNCGNLIPENVVICPFCGEKIISITEENSETQEIQDKSDNLQNFSRQLKWLDDSLILIKNNFRDIFIISFLNNPILFLLSLGIVHFWYNSYLYQFCLALKEKKEKIDFDYISNLVTGFKISLLSLLFTLPLILLALINFILFIFLATQISKNDNTALIPFFLTYFFLIASIGIIPVLMSLFRNFIIVELIDYFQNSWNILEILKKAYLNILKRWISVILLFIILLTLYSAIYTALSFICYCTLGLILLLITLPYLIVDIILIAYIFHDKFNDWQKIKGIEK